MFSNLLDVIKSYLPKKPLFSGLCNIDLKFPYHIPCRGIASHYKGLDQSTSFLCRKSNSYFFSRFPNNLLQKIKPTKTKQLKLAKMSYILKGALSFKGKRFFGPARLGYTRNQEHRLHQKLFS